MPRAAKPATAEEAAVLADTSLLEPTTVDWVVTYPAISVHVDGAEEPLTLEMGATVPPEALDQVETFRTLGYVTAVQRR